MELQKNHIYVAFLKSNPVEYFIFELLEEDDLLIVGKLLRASARPRLWEIYSVRQSGAAALPTQVEITPYYYDPSTKILKCSVIGFTNDRRKFIRYNVEPLKLKVEGDTFQGYLEDISLGGVRIKITQKKGKVENRPQRVKIYINPSESYEVEIIPVKVEEDTIRAMFGGLTAEANQSLFYRTLDLLKKYHGVEDLGVITHVEDKDLVLKTPFGDAKVLQLSEKFALIEFPSGGEQILNEPWFAGEIYFRDNPECPILVGLTFSEKVNGKKYWVEFIVGRNELKKFITSLQTTSK
ncbi:MAG: PilZ domain-containing protein [Aquificae bacterium]|nr:PilZ domain-containing protein [Aquificota bacterium]